MSLTANKIEFTVSLMIISVLIFMCIITIYPFIFVLSYSLSEGTASAAKIVILLPRSFTPENYKAVFTNNSITTAFGISVGRTVIGTMLHLLVTGMAAYSLSRKDFAAKKSVLIFFMIPMYISGGLIPMYILINKLHLMNNLLVYVLPGVFSTFNLLIIKTHFVGLPDSIEESAKMDGARDLTVLFRIVFPLSMPVLATIGLFVGVAQWNSWFDATLFITNTKLHPLQTLLYRIMLESQASSFEQIMQLSNRKTNVTSEAIKMTVLMVSIIPIICTYPFLQKYFIKGVMLGAIKE